MTLNPNTNKDGSFLITIPDEEAADLPSADSVSSAGVPTDDDISSAAADVVAAAEERMAIELAELYRHDQGLGDTSYASDYYLQILEETRDWDQEYMGEYAKEVVEEGGYFDEVPVWFERFTGSDVTALENARASLRSAWELLDALRAGGVVDQMFNDFDGWEGSGVDGFRMGFILPFAGSVYNQQLIIKSLYSNSMVFQELINEGRNKAHEIAKATSKTLRWETSENPNNASPAFSGLSGLLACAAVLAAPVEVGAGAIYFLSLMSGLTGVLSGTTGLEESGYEDPYNLNNPGDTVFDIMGKCKDLLALLRAHIQTAEDDLDSAMQNMITELESQIKRNGYLQSGRFIVPTEPILADSDFNRSDFEPPGLD